MTDRGESAEKHQFNFYDGHATRDETYVEREGVDCQHVCAACHVNVRLKSIVVVEVFDDVVVAMGLMPYSFEQV